MSRFAKNTAIFSLFTFISRLTGLVRVMAFAAVLGLLRIDDAYQLANNIPNILYEFIMGGVLSAVFIPVLVRVQQQHGKSSAEAWRVANLLLGYVGLILAAVSALATVFAPQIIHLLTFFDHGHEAAANRPLATYFLRFFTWQMFFYGLNAVFMAILNSHEVFAITALAPLFNNVVVILTLFAYGRHLIGLTGLAVGTTAGIAAMALVQVPWLIKIRMPIRPKFNLRDPLFGTLTTLATPVVGVALANLVGTAVRTNLLWSVPGGVTTFTFCFQLIMTPYGIFAVSVATVLYPALSRHANDQDLEGFRRVLSLGVRWTTLIMLPICLGMSATSEPLTRVLFERGEFTYRDTLVTASFLRLYSLSILPYALLIFATRGFFSLKDTRTPAYIMIAGVVLNIALNFLLMYLMGLSGIALAATLTAVFSACTFMLLLRRKVHRLHGREIARSLSKMALAGALMNLVVLLTLGVTDPSLKVLKQGARLPLRLPPSAAQGNTLLIRNQADWALFWKAITPNSSSSSKHEDEDLPKVNFKNASVVAVFGPQSRTTTSLELARFDVSKQDAKLQVLVNEFQLAEGKTFAADSPTSPAYAVAVVRPALQSLHPEFKITGQEPPHGFWRILHARELWRLLFTVTLGAGVYFLAAYLLRVEELHSLFQAILRRGRGTQL